jgi:hypothetical protein
VERVIAEMRKDFPEFEHWTHDEQRALRAPPQYATPTDAGVISITMDGLPDTDTRVLTQLNKYGPALIAGFRTWKETRGALTRFGHKDYLSYSGSGPATNEPLDGGHAMAIVGWRMDASKRARFLVQNWQWWGNRQYFEADLEFLASRGARVAWIKDPPSKLPTDWPTTTSMGGENDLDVVN